MPFKKIRKAFAVAGVATLAFVGAHAASAATFDFVSIADNAGDANYIGGTELNWGDTAFAAGLTIDGITLIASGSNVNNNFADAFFDKGTAGLGVCSTVLGCATGGPGNTADDNVSASQGGETLTLDFGTEVSITDIFFRAAGHGALTGSLNLNGGVLGITNGFATSGLSLLSGASVYDFKYTNSEFYISSAVVSAVPIPAAGLMLLTALGGLTAVRRRKQKAA
ncbi:MAG: VPLPA-CTERM sorting domain-containing protein [Paracoccaceae bacterium]|nr:VPLPA-CTERM sorting domain-containing protein [Paracoccaceae bacterium]